MLQYRLTESFLILFVFMELHSVFLLHKGIISDQSDDIVTLDKVIVTSPPVAQALLASQHCIIRNSGLFISRQDNLNMPYKARYYGDQF